MPSGPRIRTDNVFGTLTDNPLTNVATTMNSAGLANLAAVSSAHALIVIDPLRSAGAPEAVIVTAHTGSATSATITRGAYGTSARQHASGVLWVHCPNIEDFIRVVTASTRPSDPFEGQVAYETDRNRWIGYDGAVWRPSTHNPPMCRVNRNTDQTISNNTTTAVQFNAADTFDTQSMHDTVTNNTRVTAPEAGVYAVKFAAQFATSGTAMILELGVNGAAFSTIAREDSSGTLKLAGGDDVPLAVGDYVEGRVFQLTGGNVTLSQATLSVVWVGVG